MAYSVDLAYLDYFKNAARGMHNSTPARNRLTVTGLAAVTALVGGMRTMSRIVKLVIEIAKVIFYFSVSLITLGYFGNFNRLKNHFKLLTLNMAALVGLPLQITMHSLAIAMGIISPTAAYRMMQVGTTPLAWITSNENRIWQKYKTPKFYTKTTEALTSKIRCIFNRCPLGFQFAMKTILSEFSCSLDAGLVAPLGYMKQFHSFGANPKTLTEEQKKLTPILLLNGNFSHQGTFLPLLYTLKRSNNQRPVYTINLPPNMTSPSFIAPKIEAIKGQYGKENTDCFEIDMIGHSMGSHLIQNICYASNQTLIRRAITVGTPFFSNSIAMSAQAAFDIIGTKDCLIPHKSVLKEKHQIKIKAGHLGLLFHHKSLKAMAQLLESVHKL